MADTIYNSWFVDLLDANIDHANDTIKVALVTSTYTPNADSHEFFDDITNEVSGTGYTAGGETLTSPTTTKDNTNDRGVFDGADVTWSSSTITARGAVVYKDTGSAATSNLLCYFDFSEDKSSSSGDFTISWNADGIMYIGNSA